MSPTAAGFELAGELVGGRYRVIARLGAGAMGAVWRARDEKLDRQVVIKAPHAEQLAAPDARKRFLRETRSLVEVRHPHIVPVYDAGEHRLERDGISTDVPYVVLAFLEGGSLDRRLAPPTESGAPKAARVKQPAEEAARWIAEVAAALDFVHSQGWLHRDVKPANILFDAAGYAFLADFGIANGLDGDHATLATAGYPAGSPRYMAPELFEREEDAARLRSPSALIDQYSLAVAAFEAVAGTPPHSASSLRGLALAKLLHEPARLEDLAPETPSGCAAALRRALSTSPNDRFSTCTEFATAFRMGLATPPLGADHAAVRSLDGARLVDERRPQTGSRRIVVTAILGAATALCAILLRRPGERDDPTPRMHPAAATSDDPASRSTRVPESGPSPEAPPAASNSERAATRVAESRSAVPTTPPALTGLLPGDGAVLHAARVRFGGRSDRALRRVQVGAFLAELRDGFTFDVELPLSLGENAFALEAEDAFGNIARLRFVLKREAAAPSTPPALFGFEPADGATIPTPETTLRVRAERRLRSAVVPGARDVRCDEAGFTAVLPILPGENGFSVEAMDEHGNVARAFVRYRGVAPAESRAASSRAAESPPVFIALTPKDGTTIDSGVVDVRGTIDRTLRRASVGGVEALLDGKGGFSARLALKAGVRAYEVIAEDESGSVVRRLLTLKNATKPTWCVVLEAAPDPKVVVNAVHREAIAATGLGWRVRDTKSSLEFVLIPPGSYVRGRSEGDVMADEDEAPPHRIEIREAFYLARTEVSNRRYRDFRPSHDSGDAGGFSLGGPDLPAAYISAVDADAYCTAYGFRLPTEAEWEYAARAGVTTRYPWGDDLDKGTGHANCADATAKSRFKDWPTFPWSDGFAVASPVGRFPKNGNGFGLFDMIGNVWEWTSSYADADEYRRCANANDGNPSAPSPQSTPLARILRGASWNDRPEYCRLSNRLAQPAHHQIDTTGLRPARTP